MLPRSCTGVARMVEPRKRPSRGMPCGGSRHGRAASRRGRAAPRSRCHRGRGVRDGGPRASSTSSSCLPQRPMSRRRWTSVPRVATGRGRPCAKPVRRRWPWPWERPRHLLDDTVQPLPRAGGDVAGHVAHEGEGHAVEDGQERLAPERRRSGRLPDVELTLGSRGEPWPATTLRSRWAPASTNHAPRRGREPALASRVSPLSTAQAGRPRPAGRGLPGSAAATGAGPRPRRSGRGRTRTCAGGSSSTTAQIEPSHSVPARTETTRRAPMPAPGRHEERLVPTGQSPEDYAPSQGPRSPSSGTRRPTMVDTRAGSATSLLEE